MLSVETKNDGGSAFPVQFDDSNGDPCLRLTGMSLRDYFAGQALVGLLAHDGHPHSYAGSAAKEIYELADAMIAEREKDGNQ